MSNVQLSREYEKLDGRTTLHCAFVDLLYFQFNKVHGNLTKKLIILHKLIELIYLSFNSVLLLTLYEH
jgi:hypothetical protein